MFMLNPSMAIPSRAMIGRWTVDQYLRFSRWWIVGGVAVVVLTTIVHIIPGNPLPWNAAVFFLLGVMVNRQRGSKTESLTAGALAGLAIGFVSAVVALVLDFSFVAVVNIVAETLLTGLIAALVATVGLLLSQILWRQA